MIEDILLLQQRQLLEDNMKKQEKMLLQSEKLAAVGELAAGIGHEINNPLGIAVISLERLQTLVSAKDLDPKQMETYLQRCIEALRRISTITDGLRTMSRGDSLDAAVFSSQVILNSIVSFVKELYERKGIRIIVETDDQESLIKVNFGQVQQILMNLVSNARDAVENSSEKVIKFEIERQEPNVLFKVTDSGEGVTSEVSEKIFETFFTTKEVGKGTGMGLSVSKRLAQQNKGDLYLNTEIEKGAQFVLQLPLANPSQDSATDASEPVTMERLNGKSILVVEDEPVLRELVQMLLSEFGMKIDEAENAHLGLIKATENKYDFLLADINMPRMLGTDMLARMKQENILPDNSFLMTGGVLREVTDSKGTDIKPLIKGIIRKPFSRDDLLKSLLSAFSQ